MVKPTGHNANAASTSKTGRFAMLRGSRHAAGSGAPSRGGATAAFVARSLGALCALAAILAFSIVGVAQAEPSAIIPDGSFDPGAFPLGVAVDNTSGTSSGDVYVAALGSANVNKFDGSVPPGLLAPPSPFGEGNFSGAAVDPSNGDVYVLDAQPNKAGNLTIDTFDPSTGAPVGTPFEVPASGNFFGFYTIVQIGVDAAGDVYVPVVPQNEVLEYSSVGTLLHTFTGGSRGGALSGPTGVAVDSAGDLWVADSGNERIEELSPADTPVEVDGKPVEIESKGVQDGIALDGRGNVLAIDDNGADFCGSLEPPCSHLVEYDAAGAQVADVGAGSFGTGEGEFPLPPMVAVAEKSGLVYVTDAKGEKVWVFALPVPPRVERELSSEVTTSEAKLGALVNPGGIQTTYRFEYGTTAAYGQSAPFPEGSVGEGLVSRAVWAAASGLQPGTTYHYRVVATNELAPEGVAGPDQTFTTETAEQAVCPNEQFRGGFSAALPDCRAYELVTPATKTSVQIENGRPDIEGNAFAFNTHEPLPGAPTGGNNYVATRGADGWSSEDIIPLESYTGAVCDSHSNVVRAYSDGLSTALISVGNDTSAAQSPPLQEACNAEGLQVVPGEPVGYENLLLRDNATGAFRLVNAPPAGVTPANAHFRGASADLSHVVFSEPAALAPEAPIAAAGSPEDLYEWDEGVLRLLSVLPGEVPVQGGSLAEGTGSRPGVSADGSSILFTYGGALYVRIDGKRTVQIDESQRPGVSGGGGVFQTMSADGSTILFTDESQLTPDSTAASGEPDLYECVLPERAGGCELSDLTIAGAGEHADVQDVSAFGGPDSSYVYFAAKGVLAPGAVNGQQNLYVWHGATTALIATLTNEERATGVVSPDGTWFAFQSAKSLTGYDNIRPGGGAVLEIFLYSAVSGRLACASCNPSGEAPVDASEATKPMLADGGRLFFETQEALVPSDTNSQWDVYEYEDGQPFLISSGTSARESKLQGVSENGSNVFFLSRQQLLAQDDTGGEARVIYDARVDGGFLAPSVPPSCDNPDACRAPVAPLPSVFGAPASATFSGVGNLAPSGLAASPPPAVKPKPKAKTLACARGFVREKVRSKSRCVRKPARKAGKSAHAKKRGH
jgi:hypothetical protein